MKRQLARLAALLLALILLYAAPIAWATCGGGGGGGGGGLSSSGPGGGGGGNQPDVQVYHVPWKIRASNEPSVASGLILYWFPSSQEELQKSSLRTSRVLSLYASQCVSMEVTDLNFPLASKLGTGVKLPVAVLASPDGTIIGRADNKDGFLKVDLVEKMVQGEMKRREDAVDAQFKDAKAKAKAGDSAGAIPIFRAVVEQKCLFPGKAKDAAKELKKLGVTDVGEIHDAPNFDRALGARINRTMIRGLKAEMAGKYEEADRLYTEAHNMDLADPTPMRYLGELYRHQIGDWDKARNVFEAILNMPADPLSRAVAQHGLGKMTIHMGEFLKGLGLMEESVKTYPLALAYRNLSVYWNSEGDVKKADHYVNLALALDPKDPYNLVFAAAFMAGNGRGDEALKIAEENQSLLEASYNLAAVYAQVGQKEKALALLKRHFFEYERYDAVRSKEMMEARVDAVFNSIKSDPIFIALTSGSDGKLDPTKAMSMRP
jgi:tetratricopeptide (TPR) repeat protein